MPGKKKQTGIDLSVKVGDVRFKTPFYVSSGPASKSVEQMEKAEANGWAGASIKLTFDPAPYINLPPRYGWWPERGLLSFSAETRLNVEEGLELVRETRKRTRDFVVLANITYAGEGGIDGWVNMARRFEDAGAHIIELNMCCPNMSFNVSVSGKTAAGHRTGASLGEDAQATASITERVKQAVGIPVMVKITPEGGRIAEVARAALNAGADAICGVGNRLGIPPIDIEDPAKARYHLQQEPSMSCLSGPWIKTLALRDMYEMRKKVGPHAVLSGTGGMVTMQDTVEMMMCGADLVGFCTGILLEGYELMPGLLRELQEYMQHKGYHRPVQMRDLLVKAVTPASELTVIQGVARKKEENLAAPCVVACPAHVPAHAYVQFVARGEFRKAYEQIISRNPLQNVCGYVCSHPCQGECVRGSLDEPIRIRDIKRFVLERAKQEGWNAARMAGESRQQKVAVIGSGPAGLSCAHDLARAGYPVTVFEKDDELGGMLSWAVPAFRLPGSVLEEGIDQVRDMGVEFRTGVTFGKDMTVESLGQDGFRAIFLGVGAQRATRTGIEIDGTQGWMTALEYLRLAYCGGNPVEGKRVTVIGGGFTAVDSARTAVRQGAKAVFIVYRRTREEMPAVPEEVREAEEEGVQVMYLVSPRRLLTQDGHVTGLEMVNHVLGEEDASGRRRPVAVKETEFVLGTDVVVSATGQETDLDARWLRDGLVACDASTGATPTQGVFAGGDAVTGSGSIIDAVAAGKRAAAAIDRYLSGESAVLEPEPELRPVSEQVVLKRAGQLPRQGRVPVPVTVASDRKNDFEIYTSTMTEEEARAEAARCLNCGCGVACGVCYRVCMSNAITEQNGRYVIDREKCQACGMCFQRCPNLNIEMAPT